jgi:hypothetical protein
MREIEIAVPEDGTAADGAEELRSLLRWLRQDETLGRAVQGTMGQAGERIPGAMGTGFDVLQLVLGSALSGGSLAVSVLQWRDARRVRPALRIRRGEVVLEVPAGSQVDQRTAEAIARLLGGDEPAGGGGDELSGGGDELAGGAELSGGDALSGGDDEDGPRGDQLAS